MEPVEYLRMLRRRWAVVVAAALLAGGMGWATTPDEDELPVDPGTVYTARHTLLQDVTDERVAAVSVDRVALFATTGEVPRRVVERLGWDEEPAVVATQVTVAGDAKLGTITFTATGEDAEHVALLVDTFADETLAYFDERAEADRQAQLVRLDETATMLQRRAREFEVRLAELPEGSVDAELARAERDALIRQYGVAFDRYQQTLSAGAASIGYLSLERATPVAEEVAGFQAPSDERTRTGLGAGLGLVLGLALAFVLERTDTRLRTRQGAEEAFGLPVVATVPKLSRRARRRRELVMATQPASPGAEAYRILRLSFELMPRWIVPHHVPPLGDEPAAVPTGGARHGTERAQVVLVTSPGPGEGKTVTAANLAVSCAQAGKDVLLLDCDFRGGDLHRYFDCEPAPGVVELLSDEVDGHAIDDLAQPTQHAGVRVVTHGNLGGHPPTELLATGNRLLHAAAAAADIVVVDAGPILAVNDPGALIPFADTVVVVCRSGRTGAAAARQTTELLSRLEAPVLGVAMVGVARGGYASSSSRGSRPFRQGAGVLGLWSRKAG